jgi:hypothetical protein
MRKIKSKRAKGGNETLSRYGKMHFKRLAKKRWAKENV